MKRLFIFVIFSLLLACTPAVESTPSVVILAPTNTLLVPSPILPPSSTPQSPTPTELPPTVTVTIAPPTETPTPACVTLIYDEYAQFEIIDSLGQRVLVDVFEPEKLSKPVSDVDILLTTHTHWDHYNPDFRAAFPGKQLFVQEGSLMSPGVAIRGLASTHNAGDRFKPEGGTNYIYLIEISGLRIAHFGDIGQKSLTEEQLAVLKTVDIAITQINNPYSEMSAENRKGLDLMVQVQPKLIIPTHLNLDTVKLAVSQWQSFYSDGSKLTICDTDLNEDGTQFLLMGEAVETMVKYVDLKQWGGQ